MKYSERRSLERQIEGTLALLSKYRFSKVKDNLKEYSNNSMIYSLQLDDKTHLVVSHFCCSKTTEKQGFDLWLSKYDRASDIGIKKTTLMKTIKTSFSFPVDIQVVDQAIKSFKKKS